MGKELIKTIVIAMLLVAGGWYVYNSGRNAEALRQDLQEVSEQREEVSALHEEALTDVAELQSRLDSAVSQAAVHMQLADEAKGEAALYEAELDSVVDRLPSEVRAAVVAAVAQERNAHASVVFELEGAIFDLEESLDFAEEANVTLRNDNLRLMKLLVAEEAVTERLAKKAYPGLIGQITRDPLLKVASVATALIVLSAVAK